MIRQVSLAIDQTPERVSSKQLFRDKKVGTFYNIRHQKRDIFAGQEMVQNE